MLERIDSSADLKALPADQLPALADELRAFVVEAVARVGGHLGSNLGAVELTLALHRVFESPDDILLWDTGHQAYVHKILTGRRDQFDGLRQAGGLSGYPSRAESPHDWIENSHASTALSYACGLAQGQLAKDADERHRVAGGAEPSGAEPPDGEHARRRRIVAVVGDGALTGGMAYEALNNIGHRGLPVLTILNDNGRSYAETVSRLSEQVSRFRFSSHYRGAKRRAKPILKRFPLLHRLTSGGIEGVKAAVAEAPALQHFVEALGVTYSGPVDGHDVPRLERALRAAARQDGPVLLHVLTQKGRGYAPAESDPEMCMHDAGTFEVATGRATRPAERKWTDAFGDAVAALAEERPEVVALTAAMPGSTGLLRLAERHPDRVIDVGIAEQHAVTSAAGLALAGRLPIVAVYSTFFARAFDQANLDVGLHDEHVVFALDRAGITGDHGPSHNGVLDLALCLRIPTLTVLAPSSEEELVMMLRTAADLTGPVAVHFPKYAVVSSPETGSGLSARQVRDGADVCVVSVGDRLQAALEAADLLAADGVEAAVWDVRAVRPVDPRLLDAAATAPLVVTVENGTVGGGAGSYVADRLVERAGVREAPPVLRLGVPDGYLPHGSAERILSELGLDGPGIAAATHKVLHDDASSRSGV